MPKRGIMCRLVHALCLSVLLGWHTAVAQSPSPSPSQKRELRRSYAKRWHDVNSFIKKTGHLDVHSFLHKKSQDMLVPIELDVFLVGFGGYGAYGFYLEPSKLEELLATSFDQYCPTVWETSKMSNTCFQISYQVTSLMMDEEDPRQSLYDIEDVIRRSLQPVHPSAGAAAEGALPRYEIDAFNLEHVFDKFLAQVFVDEAAEVSDTKPWHKHNAVFIINPNKERMHPRNNATGRQEPVNMVNDWKKGDFNMQKMKQQEAGFTYTYNYYGHGQSSTFISSSNYVVIDISAGPTKYGPIISPEGGVTENSVPRLQTLYEKILSQLASVKQVTAMEQAVELADAGQRTIFEGRLASVITAAAQHVFVPDVLFPYQQPAKRLLVPVIVLRDHDVADPSNPDEQQYAHYGYEVDVQTIEQGIRMLLDPAESLVVTSVSHYLHQHPSLAAALQKSMRTEGRTYVNEGPHSPGIVMDVHTYVDSAVLLSEFGMASDMLAYGVMESHMYFNEDTADDWAAAEQAKHYQRQRMGTRILPVFLLSLKNSPQNLLLDNGGLVAANADCVIVLQLINPRDGDGFYSAGAHTGHMVQGEPVMMDSFDITRHIVAGLAAGVAGIVPPYQRMDPSSGSIQEDWRWAVGATPFGPYTGYISLNDILISHGHRNRLLTQIDSVVRDIQWREERLDDFIEDHILGPLSFVVEEVEEQHKRKLDLLAVDHTSFTYDPDTGMAVRNTTDTATQQLVAKQAALEEALSTLSYTLFDHSFFEADKQIDQLYRASEAYTVAIDQLLSTAEDKVRCCQLALRRGMNPFLIILVAVGALLGVLAVAMLVSALVAKQKRRQRYKSSVFKL